MVGIEVVGIILLSVIISRNVAIKTTLLTARGGCCINKTCGGIYQDGPAARDSGTGQIGHHI